ncbi:helix-turn-helix domain-containing protein [Ensifer sp. ENS09]|uniref:helix-turn-helix transcriptional regulator n=1 Tax=Ensifer sp. ENS09 TaxID=2769263 RepID=UPI00177EA8D4|nr:helix-turn-helix domain-containing protein [Ensifer sp. ENS09]MBD9652925.1 helix-turn-helix domain-containing protein [Ensifer sp. ENS09]
MELATTCLETSEAAAFCRLSESYLEKLRCKGNGPAFLKLGRRVRYRIADLIAWLETRIQRSTSSTLARL